MKHQSAPSPQNDGLFTVDSYLKSGSNFTYDQISVFVNKEDSITVPLRSALDFRPTRTIGGTTLSGAVNPDPDQSGSLDYKYYLGRVDQIVVKPSKEFSVIQGKSAISPAPSPIADGDMLIYTLTIPAYTESAKVVRADFADNRRYTMKDIGAFDTRIKGLEYYVSLNQLENNASSSKILDSNGLERSKYGILVDNFSTTDTQASYSDVGYDNRCLVENSELKPASLMRTFGLSWNQALSTGAYNAIGTNSKKSLMLDYTTSEFAKQKYATVEMTIAGALFGSFSGTVKLFPEFAADVDTTSTAQVVLNSTQGLDNAFNFINDAFKQIATATGLWSSDKNSPFAKVSSSSWYTSSSSSWVDNNVMLQQGHAQGGPDGVAGFFGNILTTSDSVYVNQNYNLQQQTLSTSASQVNVGSFVTDLAINPYIKPRLITFAAEGLRPNTTFHSFFDGTDVGQYITVPNRVSLNTASGFASGEIALIANTVTDLTANLASYLAGGSAYDAVIISTRERNSNTAFIINETGKPLTSKYLFGLDTGSVATISSVDDFHSTRARVNTGNNSIVFTSDAPAFNIAGNTLNIIRSSNDQIGLGATMNIISYNVTSKEAVVDTSLASYGNYYTVSYGANKTNMFGQVSGAFYVPQAIFRSGERKFRLTQSFNNSFETDSISFAEHTFVSSGLQVAKTNLIDTVYNVGVIPNIVGSVSSTTLVSQTTSSQVTDSWQVDPLAETFYVDPQVYPYGVFINDVDLFFKSIDSDNIPVSVQIRPTVNGAPHTDFWYPESVVSKYPSEVNTSDNPLWSDSTTATNFQFSSPVFLKPGLYALVVLTNSPEYQVWVAEKGATTTRGENVSVNPYVGSLYKSQNSMEYVPVINEDLMFVMNRCVFSSNPASFVFQTPTQSQVYNVDRFRVLETSLNPISDTPISVNYSFLSVPIGQAKETTYRDVLPEVIYSMGQDDLYSVGYRRKTIQSQGDFTLKLDMSSTNDAVSPVVSLESLYLNAWENFVDNGALTNDNFNIIATGAKYSNSNTITVTSNTGSGALVYLVVNDAANGNIVGVNVASSGTGYTDKFTMSITSATGSNGSIVLNTEYDSSGGPCDARYITKPIVLADGFDAGDLRVFLSANKMGNSDILVFYKLLSASDPTAFRDSPYQLMTCYNPSNTPSTTPADYREYEFRPSLTTNSVSYTSPTGSIYTNFKIFAIKIVMVSDDPAIVPKVKVLRIIALPAE